MAKKSQTSGNGTSDSKSKQVELTVKQLQEKYGEGSIMRLGDVGKVDVDVIPTGSISLDLALGVGGIPRGRVVEVYGPESSGKTTLCLHIVAEAQKMGGVAAYIDAEHALDPDYAKKIGVKIEDLLISQPDTGEQALDILESLVKSGSVDVVVIDSVAALTPRAEIEGEMDQQHVGLQARLMSHALRKLTAIVAKTKTTVIFINQLRMKIGVMFGNPETTTGGMALKFYSSIRIEIRRAAQIQASEKIVGNRVKVKIVKNKVAPPFRTCEFDILYNEGISRYSDVVNSGVQYAVLTKAGSWYNYGSHKLGQGIEGSRQFLKENPKIEKEIVDKIRLAALAQ
ncbi:MAG: recombinase RecA [Candidatus Yanofskybacteria bacterium RIFCSPLOWO2_12_FULL_44_13b]|uniref:Protein RecA n=2 Tax=Candidatus Yanofskyibacteriota TaxID=1752733 RepID=A0A1F8H344_9BACT|nr:MAG: recombinase RecA [Candidatus Yanofskybacteria bacterium RIFCSPHIGHO2_12_FULL_44_29b]OGN26453.1 MAG: recombinase RecA [Candidatus Yanofskybacteria bacterium RIFCSPLOWO2_01_FULL_44_88]OGN31398.1 MAG: recombinase RecA [Candidatus Yanofskybacteria bacterium RIFCSPLOWO2_02_FULL_44_18]OGN34608.1 MAG: recombinase RecA [Candidatus Yanofskybacteria bacterium RIFCSPLOWO2_12_FULL_44_13b]